MTLKHCITVISLTVALMGCISKERIDESMAMADEQFGDHPPEFWHGLGLKRSNVKG